MTIQKIARKDVVTASRDTTVAEIAETMRDQNVGSVVIAEERTPVGIVTDRDISVSVVAEGLDPTSMTASDVMTPDLFTADVDDGIYDVLDRMGEEAVRRVPVVDAGTLEGIATLDDFTVLLSSELENLTAVIESESPPY